MTSRSLSSVSIAAGFALLSGGAGASTDFDLSMPVRTGDRVDGHYVWSVDGIGPDSLSDAGEVAFLDIYTDQQTSQGALSSLRRGADIGDSIGGFPVTQLKAGFEASIDGNGRIAFQAFSQGSGDILFALPSFALPNLASVVGASDLVASSAPAANDGGDLVFAANWCNPTCARRWIFDPVNSVLADEIMVDGFLITDFDVPALNEVGDVAFVANHLDVSTKRGVYLFDGLSVTTLFRDGDTLANGTLGSNCCPAGLDLDDSGRVVVMWFDAVGGRVLVFGNAIALREGDAVGSDTVSFLSENVVPSVNGSGTWAVYAVLSGAVSGTAIVTNGPTVVARKGDAVAGDTIASVFGSSVNEGGQIAFQAALGEGSFAPSAAVLATPAATNARVRLTSASPASIRQTVTAPSGATDVRFGYRFETTTGTLTARFDGMEIGSIAAPASVPERDARARFLVDGALLGQTGELVITLDGPPGSRVLIDDVVFPDVQNGHFQEGGLAGWLTSGATTLVVPEPSALLAGFAALLALAALRREP